MALLYYVNCVKPNRIDAVCNLTPRAADTATPWGDGGALRAV